MSAAGGAGLQSHMQHQANLNSVQNSVINRMCHYPKIQNSTYIYCSRYIYCRLGNPLAPKMNIKIVQTCVLLESLDARINAYLGLQCYLLHVYCRMK